MKLQINGVKRKGSVTSVQGVQVTSIKGLQRKVESTRKPKSDEQNEKDTRQGRFIRDNKSFQRG